MADEAKVPTITLKLTDAEKFNIELDIELERLALMRVMLLEGLRVVEGLLQDQDAIAFQGKMNRLQQVTAAMRKGQKITM
jgi:hypothetical protein